MTTQTSLPSNSLTSKWQKYYDHTSQKTMPRMALAIAVERFKADDMPPSLAIDLGSGVGNDTAYLINQNWKVLAVDSDFVSENYLLAKIPEDKQLSLVFVPSSFERMSFPKNVPFINASYALPYASPKKFDTIMKRITHAIMPGGRFSGQFFGPEDFRMHNAERPAKVSLSLPRLKQYFEDDFKIEYLRDEKKTLRTTGNKVKHVYHIVAKKLPKQEGLLVRLHSFVKTIKNFIRHE